MNRYVVLIAAADLHALTTARDPQTALATLQLYCPIPCSLEHAIEANSRTDDLERTLAIKYQALQHHSFWYTLSPDDVTFIRTIHRDNIMKLTGLIKRQLAPPPSIAGKPIGDYIADQLALCETLLKE